MWHINTPQVHPFIKVYAYMVKYKIEDTVLLLYCNCLCNGQNVDRRLQKTMISKDGCTSKPSKRYHMRLPSNVLSLLMCYNPIKPSSSESFVQYFLTKDRKSLNSYTIIIQYIIIFIIHPFPNLLQKYVSVTIPRSSLWRGLMLWITYSFNCSYICCIVCAKKQQKKGKV